MGVSAVDHNPDLEALISGGEAFLRRVAELKDARAGYERSLADFNIGQEVVAALASAKEKEEAAVKALEDAMAQAGGLLEDARKQAAVIVEEARASAEGLLNDSQAKIAADRASLEYEMKNRQESFDSWAAGQEAKINANLEAAATARSRAEAQAKANQLAADELAVAQKDARESQAKADAATKLYTDKFNKLNAALNGV